MHVGRPRICCIVLLFLSTTLSTNHFCHGLTQKPKLVRVQVCQNKDCCQRFQGKAQNLVETIKHLSRPDTLEVESSACLSQCGKGPNICIQTPNGEEQFYGSAVDAASAGAVLEISTDTSIHPTLVAAVNVMERASKAPSLEEKERFLSSVISALQKKDDLKDCFAMAHAHAMRAKVKLKGNDFEQAVSDAEYAIQIDPTKDKAWRTLVDAQVAAGNLDGAIDALKRWSKASPSFSTKANKEIQTLREQL